MLFIFGYVLHHERKKEDEVDYSKYLGPNYRNDKKDRKRVSTVISHHIAFLDTLAYGGYVNDGRYCQFTPADFVTKAWLARVACRNVQCIEVTRETAKGNLNDVVEKIMKR